MSFKVRIHIKTICAVGELVQHNVALQDQVNRDLDMETLHKTKSDDGGVAVNEQYSLQRVRFRVGYRDTVEKIASKLTLTGFVENLKPYEVRIVAEGEQDAFDEFIAGKAQSRIVHADRHSHSPAASTNSTVMLPSSFTIFPHSASAFTVAVPLDAEGIRVDVAEACPRGILTGLSIVPISVSRMTVVSFGTGIGTSLSSFVTISIHIVDLDSRSAAISAGAAESFSLTSGILVSSRWTWVICLATTTVPFS